MSAFRIAGLFPVNKEAVAAIPSPSKCHSEPVSVSQRIPDQPDLCNGRGHVNENPDFTRTCNRSKQTLITGPINSSVKIKLYTQFLFLIKS